MRSIERRFILEQEKSPLSSDLMCFSRAVHNQRFSRKFILRWFNKLVDKNDYDGKEKREIIEWLEKHSNTG